MKTLRIACQEPVVVGMFFGLLMLGAWSWREELLMVPGLVLIGLALLASGAGFVLGGCASRVGVPVYRAVRLGTWAGFFAVAVAGACLVLMAKWRPAYFAPVSAIIICVLSALPSLLVAMVAAGFGALRFRSESYPESDSEPSDRLPPTIATSLHEIACVLQPRDDIRPLFSKGLATLAIDVQRDAVTRDYAVQHLRQVWSRAGGDPALRASVEETLAQFTEMDPVIATPALLAMHLLGTSLGADHGNIGVPAAASPPQVGAATIGQGRTSFHLPDTDLIPLVKPILATATSSENIPSRLTAVRIACERRLADFRSDLLSMLQSRDEHTLVRMAAANALGKIAVPADLALLASFDPGDQRVATAVRHALKPHSPN